MDPFAGDHDVDLIAQEAAVALGEAAGQPVAPDAEPEPLAGIGCRWGFFALRYLQRNRYL